jgi:hypothetical protein
MVFTVTPHDSQDVQNWHNLGAAQNQLRYQTLNNYLKDMRQMNEERYKEWVRVLNTLYQIYPHVLQSQSPAGLQTWNDQTGELLKLFQNWPTGIPSQQPIVLPLPQVTSTTSTTQQQNNQQQQQSNQQQSGQQTNQQNP